MVSRPNTKAKRDRRHARLRFKIKGTPERPRLCVFRSEKHIYAQIIDDVAGTTLVAAASNEKGFEGSGSNKEGARQVGKLVAERALAKGIDTVELLSSGIRADVIEVGENGSLRLRAGIMKVTASQDEVRLITDAPKKKQSVSAAAGSALRAVSCSPELDIRGMMADEAELVVERYIDNAARARLKTVTIIHGKGTGALRSAVQQMLRRNRLVKNFRLGRYGEGETGVTVVELK